METEIVEIVETASPVIPTSFAPNAYIAVGVVAGAAGVLAAVGFVKWRNKKAALAALETEDQTAE
jgi:hypothetical protein